ncbi:MAG: BrnT family toxin [Anaerolineae bacterium]|nr:BrnT family toxin [Anaerolineae bacterium]
MPIQRVRWLEEIEDKLLVKHNVLAEEVEDVLFGAPYTRFVETGHREGEDLYAAYGRTVGGRYLIVFYLLKPGSEALIVSARDMDSKERRQYERR